MAGDMTSEDATFSWIDSLVFALSLALCAGIGVYYACTGGKQKTTEEFFVGNKRMSTIPVSLSLMASFISAIAVVGFPAEMYLYGVEYSIYIFSGLISMTAAAYIYLPVYHRLGITSAYEYLEMRFNRSARLLGTMTFMLMTLLYMAIALYTPALALSQVTGLSLWLTVISTGVVCTFYTTIGGMKAVLWTDTVQMFILFAGVLAIDIRGLITIGGWGEMWEIAKAGERTSFFNFDPNPTVRYSFWATIVGGSVQSLALYGANQSMIQRYNSIKHPTHAQIAILLNFPYKLVLLFVLTLLSMLMYAHYATCDPLAARYVAKSDQLVPLFAMQMLGFMRGAPGLFVAACYSGALSTISSGVNSLSAVTVEDFIKPNHQKKKGENIDEAAATRLSKWLAFWYGVVCIILALVCKFLDKTVVRLCTSVFGAVGGPLLGLFTLGIMFPKVNSIGAIAGLVTSLLLNLWLMIGAQMTSFPRELLPLSTEGCESEGSDFFPNATAAAASLLMNETTTSLPQPGYSVITTIYSISHLWYGLIAMVVCCTVGIIVSCVTGNNKTMNPILIFTPITKLTCCMPSTIYQDPQEKNELKLMEKGKLKEKG